jgi:hypothetical protein
MEFSSEPVNVAEVTLFYSPPGVGKTELAANYPDPIFLMIGIEMGLLTLIKHGRVRPDMPKNKSPIGNWQTLHGSLDSIERLTHPYQTLVLDTLNGAQHLLKQFVIEQDFDNDPDKFDSYGKGWARTAQPWKEFLTRLDYIRHRRGMRILMLAHSSVNKIGNPDGDDYQSNTPELHEKYIWNQTNAWADNVLFGNLEVVAVKQKGASKAKVNKGDRRVIYVHATASHFAKNRWGLIDPVSMGKNGTEAYANLMADIKKARVKKPTTTDDGFDHGTPKPTEQASTQPDAATLGAWSKRITATKKFPVCLNLFADIAEAATHATPGASQDSFATVLQSWTKRCVELADGDLDQLFMLKAKLEERADLPGVEACKKIVAEGGQ